MRQQPVALVRSLADYKQGMSALHTAFPDLRFTIDDEIAEGNKVAVRWTLRATHKPTATPPGQDA